MKGRVDTLLLKRESRNEAPTLQNSPGSETEREVLELLRHRAGYPPSLEEIRSSLLPVFTELQIQKAIIGLVGEGTVLIVQDSNSSGLRLATSNTTVQRP